MLYLARKSNLFSEHVKIASAMRDSTIEASHGSKTCRW